MNDSKYQVMPDMSEDEYNELKADIAERGVMVPIELDEDGNVLDGHHRLRACKELGITDYPTITREGMTETEKVLHAYTLNTARRHLNREQKAEAVRDLLRRDPSLSDRKIAASVGVSHPTVAKYRREITGAGPVVKVTTPTEKAVPQKDPTLKWQCCICRQHFPVYTLNGQMTRDGINNAWPLSMTGYCCDHCDKTIVTPSRIVLAMTKEAEGEEAMRELEKKLIATDECTAYTIDADGLPDYEYPRVAAVLDAISGGDATAFTAYNERVAEWADRIVGEAAEADTLEAWEAARDKLEVLRRECEGITRAARDREA